MLEGLARCWRVLPDLVEGSCPMVVGSCPMVGGSCPMVGGFCPMVGSSCPMVGGPREGPARCGRVLPDGGMVLPNSNTFLHTS